MHCFTKTCTQKISGRNLKYEAILKIIQNEEYLKGMNFHQNIKKNGKPIEGLYAIGNNAASSMGESYPGAGVTIGPALTFGYIAARHMSGAND